MATKRALVLSGGGAKGAFQFGAIKYIEENLRKQHPGFDYSIIAGVSVGALNAVMLAMGKYAALQNIWENISNDQVYKGRVNWLAAVRVLFGARSVLSNRPLRDSDLGDSLDFSSGMTGMRIEKGYRTAEKAFQGYDVLP